MQHQFPSAETPNLKFPHHKQTLFKPDGRRLHLYSRRPIPEGLTAPSPQNTPVDANPHLRWHPLRGEWVAYASHRQNRTFMPPKEYNPLLPTESKEFPTELPKGDYDMAVFDNLFPSLAEQAHSAPELGVPTEPANGACEVVVFTQDPGTSLGALPLQQVELLLDVWSDRFNELAKRPEIQYVMPFENRGVEVGVTLHHPHGQLYAYPFVPPVAARELELGQRYFDENGSGLLEDLIAHEVQAGNRIVYLGDEAIAFVPSWARYTYEVWIAPRRQVGALADCTPEQKKDLARALKTVLLKYDGLWKRPFPYLMVTHQAPTNERMHRGAHFHLELYPPYRTRDRLKYLAGTELGAGMFANDSIPEEKAAELQSVSIEQLESVHEENHGNR